MQNFYANAELARMRIQERVMEADAARQAATAPSHPARRFGRIGTALRNALAAAPESDLEFLPQLVDYPAHAA
jgi:hypothetical protein